MRNILIIGAGRSASSLIKYLLDKSSEEDLHLLIADISLELADRKTNNHPNATAIALDILNEQQRNKTVASSDLVISMLPAHLHIEVAKDCIRFKKHMVTASYISEQMQALDDEAKANELVFMNEVGLDPGIDHMSAMKVIDEIKQQGGVIKSFKSYCGGLVAPESNTNLWEYKFTWAPRNVVLAGQGGVAKYLEKGQFKYIPYVNLFRRAEKINVNGFGDFEAYANRDAMKYKSIYGIDEAETMYRGTIRNIGFSAAWNVFVQLGMTDDSYKMETTATMTYREFLNSFLPFDNVLSVESKLKRFLEADQKAAIFEKIAELDLFSSTKIVGLVQASPAEILEKILTESWFLQPTDKDMIVMCHEFGYQINGKDKQIDSKMVCIGEDQTYTAMAKTVGLPVAMTSLLILNGKINTYGVQLPIHKNIYEPILKELEKHGVVFEEIYS
ncbi:saccharopine dehydrogenase [Flavobacterium faecale]|uniref:Saccharopine dehydrogenase n=1 Tax=Flavobacterium faecale TaxID=1355330 RepID=A0A2S1LIJ1_9FLAO|nr:saccharopine dehydrogenase C-terminal domain-containing protein [Flavobacterium faecale]AWG23537.1 saccharopine dehydrogenase [Flavobacterium faecale]